MVSGVVGFVCSSCSKVGKDVVVDLLLLEKKCVCCCLIGVVVLMLVVVIVLLMIFDFEFKLFNDDIVI